MVWFQCEDCGENLKKPKLPNHFRVCSAYKLSCIDCGKTFDQNSVQSHTQCISEAEKYGPKDQGKASQNTPAKPEKPKRNAEVDVNVGLSIRPPWFCSLCNTTTTSKQTLLLHADGKKHRAKAKAYHASRNQSSQTVVSASNKEVSGDKPFASSDGSNNMKNEDKPEDESVSCKLVAEVKNGSLEQRKIKDDASEFTNGEVIQAGETEKADKQPKKRKHPGDQEKQSKSKQDSTHKIKWKKFVISTLKPIPDQTMKIKKLQRIVIKMAQESGASEEEEQLQAKLMDKINSSSRFVVDNKKIKLVIKAEES
ncbi:UBP1-associated proteins 1C-like [Zingiber officinale]|uniref:U1-type domain-containing protein n=1 Tax=Zingiber officinale TaxID=94328 RepID=A0A8J5I0S4_ZINOF|nr:UBP1-associated proteins 1C-like [Zingiber officinale]KAG6524692.1 hypothetical protein ZIOFF_014627 [Zingiber officinale]